MRVGGALPTVYGVWGRRGALVGACARLARADLEHLLELVLLLVFVLVVGFVVVVLFILVIYFAVAVFVVVLVVVGFFRGRVLLL